MAKTWTLVHLQRSFSTEDRALGYKRESFKPNSSQKNCIYSLELIPIVKWGGGRKESWLLSWRPCSKNKGSNKAVNMICGPQQKQPPRLYVFILYRHLSKPFPQRRRACSSYTRREKQLLQPQNESMNLCPARYCIKSSWKTHPSTLAFLSHFFLFLDQTWKQRNETSTKMTPHSSQACTWAYHNPDICLKQAKQVTHWVSNIYWQHLLIAGVLVLHDYIIGFDFVNGRLNLLNNLTSG